MQGLIERAYAAPVGVVLKVSAQNITHQRRRCSIACYQNNQLIFVHRRRFGLFI